VKYKQCEADICEYLDDRWNH